MLEDVINFLKCPAFPGSCLLAARCAGAGFQALHHASHLDLGRQGAQRSSGLRSCRKAPTGAVTADDRAASSVPGKTSKDRGGSSDLTTLPAGFIGKGPAPCRPQSNKNKGKVKHSVAQTKGHACGAASCGAREERPLLRNRYHA